MPMEWEHLKELVKKSYEKKGKPKKEAERIGYATATKQFMKRHGGETPQHYAKGHKC